MERSPGTPKLAVGIVFGCQNRRKCNAICLNIHPESFEGWKPPICQQLEWRCGDTCTPNEQQTSLLAGTSGALCADKPFQHIVLHQAGIPVLIRSDMAAGWSEMWTLTTFSLPDTAGGGCSTWYSSSLSGGSTSESRYRKDPNHNFSCLPSYGLSVARAETTQRAIESSCCMKYNYLFLVASGVKLLCLFECHRWR